MMSAADDSHREKAPRSEGKPSTADERRFLSDLLNGLAEEDQAAHDALVQANPDLVEDYGETDDLRGRLRVVLTGQTGTPLSPEQRSLAERTKAALAEYRAEAGRTVPSGAADEAPGILTSMTRQLPPEKAVELYRKITPTFVYEVLNRLNESASLRVVHQLVDHLCSEEVQRRLRGCEHVRDGILDEFCTVLGQSDIRPDISREELQGVLDDSGAMNDLIAMENCIKLAASKAG